MNNNEIDGETLLKTIELQEIARFDKIRHWQKDVWNEGDPVDEGDD